MNNGISAGKDYAYLLGAYLGDGSIFQRTKNGYAFNIEAIDIDFIDKVSNTIYNLIGKNPKKYTERKRGKNRNIIYGFQMCNIFFKEFMDITDGKRILPSFIFEWDKENKKAFLEGLMDSEGWITERVNKAGIKQYQMGFGVTSSWCYDIYRIFSSLGIQCCEPYIQHYSNKKDMIIFTIKIPSWIQGGFIFSAKRKQMRIDNYAKKIGFSPSTTTRSA